MKKRNTFKLLTGLLLMLFMLQFSFAQDGKDYDLKKANFWKQYMLYKETLKYNPSAVKPIDPSGLFEIDQNNEMRSKSSDNNINLPVNQNAPWVNGGEHDLVSIDYTWSQTTGTYTPVSGTVLGTNANDDNTFAATPIGFNFVYEGITYTSVDINANGYIKFGTISGSHYPQVLSLQTNIFAALNNDLRANNTTSTLQYFTTGSVGSRTMTIQWANYGFYNAGYDGSDISFQIILSETSNTIQVVYGAFPTIVVVPYTTQVGMNTTTLDFNNRTTTTDWAATTAGGSNLAGLTLSSSIKPSSGLTYTWTPSVMSYSSSTTAQLQSGQSIIVPSNNNQILQIQVVTTGSNNPISATSFNLGTNGSTNPVTDISNAKLYYTGTSAVFSTSVLFGSTASPNGTFTINGSQSLPSGTSYFWLVYDVPSSGINGDVVDAQCNSITINSISQIPTVIAPAGNRPLLVPSPLCGIKNIPGDYPTITAAINDLNLNGVGCNGVTFNVAANFRENNTGNLIISCLTSPPSVSRPIVFQKSGAGANPLITSGPGVSTTLDGIIILNGVNYVTFDGIDLMDSTGNINTTTQMEWGYAVLKQNGTTGSSNNVIKNCTITLQKSNVNSVGIYTGNHTPLSTTAITVTALSGASSYNKYLSNTIQNCFIGMQIQGYSAATPFDLYDQGNEVGTIGGGRSQILNFGNGTSATSAYGIRAINQNNLKIYNTYINSTGGADNNSTLNGIFLSTGTNSNFDIYNDTVTVVSGATTSQLVGITTDMGATGNGNTVNIYNNVVQNCLYPLATSGEFRGIANNASTATNINIYNNKVINNTLPGTGQFAGLYLAASTSTNMINENVYNNVVSGNTKTGTSGIMYMCYVNGSVQNKRFYNNQLLNNSNSLSASATYGYYNNGVDFNEYVYNNLISGNTGGTSTFYCLNATSGSGTNKYIYNNNINSNSGANQVGGIFHNLTTDAQIYNNNIYNLSTTNSTGLAPAIFGIGTSTTGINTLIYNNFISDLRAPNATGITSVYGMWLLSTGTISAYYNTIYLNASSSSTTFGSAGVNYTNAAATVPLLDFRNNIVVNNSTPGTSGRTVALARSTTSLVNYNSLSGNNCLYAGTPSATNLIYFDGTNSDQTLQAFKNRVGPREQASFSQIPPFVNIGATPYDLHIQTGTGSQVEKGGQPVSVTVDYDGVTRDATFPDVGADEIAGIMTDNASPLITYTLLGNSDASSPRNVAGISITDPSGINTTAGTKPRIYYKKSTNANTFNDNTNATDGWKYVEASNASSPFSFAMDYSLINGGIAAGNIIQYFVVAQDLNGTPFIGLNNGAFTLQPASVNLAAANFPLNGTINQFTITTSAGLSGTINVGSTEIITSLTNTGGAFALINGSSLSGNVILNITSDLTAELGTVALNQWSEIGAGNYTVTIVSSAATIRTIAGTLASNGLVRLDGADRVTIDGRFGGSGQFLRFRNLSTSGSTVLLLNDAKNNTVRNCILEGNSTSSAGNGAGVITLGTTTLTDGNDNNTITYNEVRDRSDAAGFPALGIFSSGTTTTLQQYNNNCVISNNNVHDCYLDGGTVQGGIYASTGSSGFNIDSNSVYQITSRSVVTTGTTIFGIGISNSSTLAINGGFNIRNNYIGGSAPLCTGTPYTIGVASTTPIYGLRAIQIVTGQIPNSIQGNVVANFDLTVNGGASNFLFAGIAGGNGIHNVGTIAGNTIGSGTGTGSIKITINGATGATIVRGISLGFFTSTVWGGNVDNNIVGSFTIGGPITGTGTTCDFISIGASAGWQNDFSVSNNTVGSQTTANSINFTYTSASTNMRGISIFPVQGVNATVNNNKVMNITDQSNSTGSVFFSMLMNSGAAPLKYNITNNTVANLSSAMTSASTNALNGIYLITSYNNVNISGNLVQNLSLTNTGAFSSGVIGMLTQTNNYMSGTITKNKVSGLTNQLTGSFPAVMGMWMINGADWNVSNNMFTLTNGETTLDMNNNNFRVPVEKVDYTVKNILPGFEVPYNYIPHEEKYENIPAETPSMSEFMISSSSLKPNVSDKKTDVKESKTKNEKTEVDAFTTGMPIYGIYDQTSGGTKSLNYNSIYIGGSNTGTAFSSYCYYKLGTDIASLRNNLFFNNRTGTGIHYAIANDAGTPSNGWNNTASNYNAFVTSDSTAIGSWGLVNRSIDTWRSSSLGDNQSWYAKTTQVSASNLFTNISTGDLHINTTNSAAWLVSGKGLAIAGFNQDYDGNARSVTVTGGVTDIGAHEFAATPPGNPSALQSAAPTSGGTTDYILFGRKIATINWGTGGTYPASLNINYFSGVNPVAPNVTTPNRTSNSYWTVIPTGTFSGTTYDITWYFGDNETYSITSPSTNVLMAKNDNTFWMTYPQGSGNFQSELNASALSLKVRGLLGFSSFTLSDAALPAEFPRSPLNNATNQPANVTLVWSKSAIASTYRVQLATDSLFSTLIVNDSTLTDTTRLCTGLLNNTNYWWRVNGKNGTGTGGWSQVFKFNVNFVLAPAAPTLFSPANNSTNQPVALNLVWFKSPNATSYRVQLSTENTFTTGLILNDSTVTDSIRAVSGLSNSTTYFWRVNAKNIAGTSAYSTTWQFTTAPLGPAVVNLTVIPGGFYNTGNGRLNMRDTIRVYLVDSTTCLKVDSAKGVLDSVNFTTNISFSNANSGNYYMIVYHRNHIAAATRFKTTVTRGSSVGYDFTTDSTKAYGFNMIKVSNSPVRWALIPGDANRDGFVDGLDQTIWIGQNGLDGYLSADFNGDSFIDGLDQTLWVIYNGNSSFLPCGFTLDPVTQQIIVNNANYDAKKSNRIMFDIRKKENPAENNVKQNNSRK